ncbi:hypothetical protein BDK51DRAFT_41301 [Blyttiomyces helicus]|uniref:Cyclin C-terminal domain-containing protein n=1 Tax=Blyttiomyces helicus TaxID=388810 RepID=A0A4P9W1P5_9FUNG|nr:hypothetical protein BDK51DRAFT_41301 [Blyttiomyces helicus]|eukprot:RKO85083.1 hypothetical protein BDK51DRAFT_41301 [Blyttiomyces helicus]
MTCLFLSAKVENAFKPLEELSKKAKWPKPDEMLALEFTLSKGLKYDFSVHHPYWALHGLLLDMQQYLKETPSRARAEAYEKLTATYNLAVQRVTAATLTDLPLTHPPSQIALGCFIGAARECDFRSQAESFMQKRLSKESPEALTELRARLDDAAAQALIQSRFLNEDKKVVQARLRAQASPIDAKLKLCRNPERNPDSLL